MCACVCLDGGVSTQHQAALRPQQVTPLVIKLHLQPLSLLGGQRQQGKFQLFNHTFGCLGNQPPSLDVAPKGFGDFVPETGMKTRCIFLIINHSITATIHILRSMLHCLQLGITKKNRQYSGFGDCLLGHCQYLANRIGFAIVTRKSVPVCIHLRLQCLYLSMHMPNHALVFATCSISWNSHIV